MAVNISIVNRSDNKAITISRVATEGEVMTSFTYKLRFCTSRTTPLSYVESKEYLWSDLVNSIEIFTADVLDESNVAMIDGDYYPDGIFELVVDGFVGGIAMEQISEKKLFTMNVKKIIYQAAIDIASENVLKSNDRYIDNVFYSYVRLKGINSSAVTGLEDQLMINLESLQQLCQNL